MAKGGPGGGGGCLAEAWWASRGSRDERNAREGGGVRWEGGQGRERGKEGGGQGRERGKESKEGGGQE